MSGFKPNPCADWPILTMVLGDLSADVIKVEPPPTAVDGEHTEDVLRELGYGEDGRKV